MKKNQKQKHEEDEMEQQITERFLEDIEKNGLCAYGRLKRLFPTSRQMKTMSSSETEPQKSTNAHSPEDGTRNG